MARDRPPPTVMRMRHHHIGQQLGSHASGGLLSGGLLSQFSSFSPDNMLLYVAAGVGVVVWQFVPRPATAKKLLLMPAVCLYFGLKDWSNPDAFGLAMFAVSLVAAILLGLLRGTTVRVWRTDVGEWVRQGTALTLVVWGISIAIRLGLDGLVYLHGGSAGANSSSEFALLFGASAAASNFVIWLKSGQHRTVFRPATASAR
ncbi:MAG: hypothetical protein ACYDAL_16030 [Candidatus Dormibacteraceae bacterium]